MLKCFIILTLYKHYTSVIQILTLLGTIKNYENFNLHVNGQCLKNSHWFCLNFVCEMRIYLFGSYLRFKSVYKFWDIKLYDLPLILQNTLLKFKVRA